MPGYGRRCAFIFSVLFSSRHIELELVIFGKELPDMIYGSCPKPLFYVSEWHVVFFFALICSCERCGEAGRKVMRKVM